MGDAWDMVVERFGHDNVHTKIWGPTQFRVTVSGWQVHHGASTSQPVGDGRSLERACEALLRHVDDPAAWVHEGEMCQDHTCCAEYSRMRDKQAINRQRWHENLERSAAAVRRWPAWRRGLAPCAEEGCEGEYKHKGKHWRAKPIEFDEWDD